MQPSSPSFAHTAAAVSQALQGIVDSPRQSAAFLALLAGTALVSPIMGVAAALAGLAFHLQRPSDATTPLDTAAGQDAGPPDPSELFHLGVDLTTGQSVDLTGRAMLQNILLTADDGEDRSEVLLGLLEGRVAGGKGFVLVDGKGDLSKYANISSMARKYGREDDVMVLNFMTGNTIAGNTHGRILSHKINPFSTHSVDRLTQMVVDLMDDSGGDGAMWKGRAAAMFSAVMKALVWLRDEGLVDLSVGTIRDCLNLRQIIDLANPAEYPQMPPSVRNSVNSYLTSLPGFNKDRGYKQAQTTLDQHGYLEMQFTRIMGSLSDIFGHIFLTRYSDVDMRDVLENHRILVVMLPSLAMSGDEISNIAKLLVGNITATASQMKDERSLSGEAPPSASGQPPLVVLDDLEQYWSRLEMERLASAASGSIALILGFGRPYKPLSGDIAAIAGVRMMLREPIDTRTRPHLTVVFGDAVSDVAPPHFRVPHSRETLHANIFVAPCA